LKDKIIVLFWLWKKSVYLAPFFTFFLKKVIFDRYYLYFLDIKKKNVFDNFAITTHNTY